VKVSPVGASLNCEQKLRSSRELAQIVKLG
jgi:hypothetical protein